MKAVDVGLQPVQAAGCTDVPCPIPVRAARPWVVMTTLIRTVPVCACVYQLLCPVCACSRPTACMLSRSTARWLTRSAVRMLTRSSAVGMLTNSTVRMRFHTSSNHVMLCLSAGSVIMFSIA